MVGQAKTVSLDAGLFWGFVREVSIDSLLTQQLGIQVNIDACVRGEIDRITLLDAVLVSALLFAQSRYTFKTKLDREMFFSTLEMPMAVSRLG